jgi:hypothetical protein
MMDYALEKVRSTPETSVRALWELGSRSLLIAEQTFPFVLFLLGLAAVFRMVLLHPKTYSLGDNGDGLILIATLEHWYNVVLGHPIAGDWRATGFFYPAPGTLGLTDTFFLYALPYCALRAMNIGPFAAFTGSVLVFAGIGFWTMQQLCRRWLKAARPFAAIAAYLFAFGAMMSWGLDHAQTYTIMLAPCVCLCLLAGLRVSRAPQRVATGAAGGLLFGFMVFSNAQTPWFLVFAGGLAVIAWLVLERPALNSERIRHIVMIGAGFAIGLIVPFVAVAVVYLPGLAQHTRPFAEVLLYSPVPSDLIHTPPRTPIWSDLLQELGIVRDAGRPIAEVALGYTPVFLLSTLAGGALLLPATRALGGMTTRDRAALACIIGALSTWALELNYHGFHPWRLIFDWVPAAKAIRTPFRSQIAANFLMCCALAHIATRLAASAIAAVGRQVVDAHRYRSGQVGAAALVLLGSALGVSVAEQVGPGTIVRRTGDIGSWLRLAHRPAFPCEAFYLLADAASPMPFWARQSDAMMLAQWIHMPTLNGSSSWFPNGWNLMHPEAPDYDEKVFAWVKTNGLEGRVCGVNPRTNTWVPGFPAPPR